MVGKIHHTRQPASDHTISAKDNIFMALCASYSSSFSQMNTKPRAGSITFLDKTRLTQLRQVFLDNNVNADNITVMPNGYILPNEQEELLDLLDDDSDFSLISSQHKSTIILGHIQFDDRTVHLNFEEFSKAAKVLPNAGAAPEKIPSKTDPRSTHLRTPTSQFL